MNKNELDDPSFKQKIAYPYEYFNTKNFNEPLNLKNDFFSTLNQGCPNDCDIERTNEIINRFCIKNGIQLTMLYLKTDVLQLADIFENFIKTSKINYEINPLYCYSLPGYTWKAGLKYTKVKLDPIKDKKLLLLENNIRGGISGVMGDRYIKSDENYKVLYIDANNLYGWAMSQYLPTGDFKDLIEIKSEQELLEKIINSTDDDNQIGYFIECDLEYPQNIKPLTKNFPHVPI